MLRQDLVRKIHITNYENLKDFFKAYASSKKREHQDWSLSEWARALGLEATSSLTMIINGQRNIGPAIEKSLANYFSFSEKELRHFQMLIKKDKLSDFDPVKQILETEIALNTKAKPIIKLNEKQWSKINHWCFLAIRQLARIVPVPRSHSFLKKILQGDESTSFLDAVDTLAELGLLVDVNGKYEASEIILSTTQNISSEAIKEHHEEMGSLALKAIRKFDVKMRNFQSCTFALDRKNFSQAHDLIEKFINDFETLVDSQKSDSVYQLNIQLFPLAVLNENDITN